MLQELSEIGFDKAESEIYLSLLKSGPVSAGKIAKATQINRTTVYDVLERLIKKGLITYQYETKTKLFCVVNPKRILEIAKEQLDTTKDMLPELVNLYSKSKDIEDFRIYRGTKGIKNILNDILNYKSYVAYGSKGQFLEHVKLYFLKFQKQKKKLKINARIIMSEKYRSSEEVQKSYSKFKYIPDNFAGLTTTFVYGSNTAIIIWGEIPNATVIINQDVAKSYLSYFELLWKTAKE